MMRMLFGDTSDSRTWVPLALVVIPASVSSVIGIIGIVLWLKLFFSLESLKVAGECVARVGIPPAVAVAWSLIGLTIHALRNSRWWIAAYVLLTTFVLYFAIYSMLFLFWAIRVWPDQCICSCT